MSPRPVLSDQTNVPPLTSLLSSASALFCTTEPSQPLSPQSLPHSFPFNGGGRGCVGDFARHDFPYLALCLPFYFQQLPTVKFRNPFALITIRIARGWVYPFHRGVKVLLEVRRGLPLDLERPRVTWPTYGARDSRPVVGALTTARVRQAQDGKLAEVGGFGTGGGNGQPSASNWVGATRLEIEGFGGGRGNGQPSASNRVGATRGGLGGPGGSGQPSAINWMGETRGELGGPGGVGGGNGEPESASDF